MPRKTKDSENKDVELKKDDKKKVAKSTTKKVATKKTTAKKDSEEKNSKAKTTKSKTTTKKSTSSTKTKKDENVKAPSKKASTTTKKASTKKTAAKKDSEEKDSKTKAKTTTKKSTSSTKKDENVKAPSKKASATTKKTAVKKATKKVSSKKPESVEYYDLPYRYNQTVVKILAQTPTNLFIYWDISDEDRENYKKQYGDNFFETTKPILKIYNDTLNYDFEIEINDFANSWYLHINDSKCDYRAELGRRPINVNSNIKENYIYISSSNEIESPNDKILFNTLDKMVYFKNTKTNDVSEKSFANLSFLRNMGKIYNIYDFYRELYTDEDIESFSNPSSGMF